MFKVRRALVSVSDKRNLIPFAQGLHRMGVEILTTGGTGRQLTEAGIDAVEVSSKTGFPEIMGGRVKTLHPIIHGGLLGRRGTDDDVMTEFGLRGLLADIPVTIPSIIVHRQFPVLSRRREIALIRRGKLTE